MGTIKASVPKMSEGGEALILLVAIVALFQSAAKLKNAQPDCAAFAIFFLLVASLSALVCVRGT
jgi:hypothetical protein